MKKLMLSVGILFVFTNGINAQHLPHQIGNQWHYDMTNSPPGIDYAAIAVDTVVINNKTYFKFERRDAFTGELMETTYDRFEGDSAYYRNYNGEDSLIINFNWPEGFTRVTTNDSLCFDFNRLWFIGQHNIWGFITQSYHFIGGFWCVGMQDTAWLLFVSEITRELGCYNDGDGWLQGIIIDGVTYGDIYPLPVELVTFDVSVLDKNVTLTWITASELNNSGFEIQRIDKTKNIWKEIGFIEGKGTTSEIQYYSFIDENVPSGKYRYRLKQVDFDGTFEYSEIIEVVVGTPTEFSLGQNYPNPFNPSTTINYSIPEFSFVTLKVYDVLGSEVATLVNEDKSVGSYEVEFDANELTSGIYFYKIQSGSFVETKKMVLMK